MKRLILYVLTGALSTGSVLAANAVNDQRALGKLHEYAKCLVEKRPNVVRNTLKLDFRSKEYEKQMTQLAVAKNGCIQAGRMKMAPVLFAGSLAEAAFEVDYQGRQAASLLPDDWTKNPIAARSESEVVALCMVQKRPSEIQAMLGTDPATDGEKAAFAPLIADLPLCVSAGSTLKFNQPMLRAIFALGLYRAVRHFGGVDA